MSTNRFVLSLCVASGLSATAAAGDVWLDPVIPNHLIVYVNQSSTLEAFVGVVTDDWPIESIESIDQVEGRKIYLLEFEMAAGTPQIVMEQFEESLEADYTSFLISADFLYQTETAEGKTGSVWVDSLDAPAFFSQYPMDLLQIELAQAMSTGAGTVVAVVDTGIDTTHPQLAARIAPGGYDFVDQTTVIQDVGDGLDNDGDGLTDEMVGHGTFVAGLVSLIAPEAKILPVRVLDTEGVGNEWLVTKGIYYAIDRGVEVINLSLGSTYDTNTVKSAIAEATTLGIPVVVASGNFNHAEPREYAAMDDLELDDAIWPVINSPGSFGIAATDHNDIKADFSNFDDHLVFSAPGASADGPFDPATAIVSTVPGGGYTRWEGTSFAAPFVSATIALLRAQHPEWEANQATYDMIFNTLAAASVNIYPLNPTFAADQQLGVGRIDTGATLAPGGVAPMPGDLNADGVVGFADLLALLADWNEIHSSADLDGGGGVAFGDLLILLSNWG